MNVQTFILEQQRYYDTLLRAFPNMDQQTIFMLVLRLVKMLHPDFGNSQQIIQIIPVS